jgi:hypothetical protein
MSVEKLLPRNSKRREIVKKIYCKFFRQYNHEEMMYKKWIKQNEPNKNEIRKQRNIKFKIEPKISILVPLYNTPEKFFKELLQSLQNQTYSNWQLCLADGSPKPLNYIQNYLKDERVSYKIIGENKGISGNTNEALKLATGDFIGLLDHDDLLPIFSFYEIVKAINENPNVEFIYTDEDKLENSKGPRYGVFFKPDFSPYTLNSANYICHFSIFKKELMDKLEGFRSEYDGSQDFDIVARATELTNNIVHIPKVLYHWRVHQNSTAGNSDSKPYAFEVGKKVIKDHVKRKLKIDVDVTDGLTPGSYELKYEVTGNPKVSIILNLKDVEKQRAEEILKEVQKTTYKNYEIISISKDNILNIEKNIIPSENENETYNKAVEISEGDYFIIFDENLLEIDRKDYIECLLGICQDKDVAIVGTKLYNEQDLIEHAGIILGMNGAGDFLYKGAPKNAGTYMQRLLIIHNVNCVYMKYAMIDKNEFEKINGFNYEENELLTSIDYCLKQIENNKQIILNPIIAIKIRKIEDYEKENEEEFINKWKKQYEIGDKYFSPNLSKNDTNLSFNV